MSSSLEPLGELGWLTPITSDQDCGLLGCTVHHCLGHARVLPSMTELGVQDSQVPNSFLLCTGNSKV